jgi:hypothetical protein
VLLLTEAAQAGIVTPTLECEGAVYTDDVSDGQFTYF